MSLGTEFLDELGRRGQKYSHFKYDELQTLKGITSPDELRSFFEGLELKSISTVGTTAQIVDSFLQCKENRRLRDSVVGAFTSHPLGCLIGVLIGFIGLIFSSAFRPRSGQPPKRLFVFLYSVSVSVSLAVIPAAIAYYIFESTFATLAAGGVTLFILFFAAIFAAYDSAA